MRVDVITIFPAYLTPLDLSLAGKAQQRGLLDVRLHDLRQWASDRHRTVDDTPYGGGAGMVMKPEPWGAALDAVVADDTAAVLVVPTPGGELFTQRLAARLATERRLVFACGRYEGIDQRVVDHARTRMRVQEVSLGDYVLGGGEVAALVIMEAVARLVPGVVGNPESLVEESHGDDGLLEHPVYTKPPSWRGLDVPSVLMSGDHGAVRQWRHAEALRRTAHRRPDLVHGSRLLEAGLDGAELRLATPADTGELFTLQRACWVQEAFANDSLAIPALHETLADVRRSLAEWETFVVRHSGRLVGSVRGALRDGGAWDIGRLMVAPDLQGLGLGGVLLRHIESVAPEAATSYRLFTAAGNAGNIAMYKRAGYRLRGGLPDVPGAVLLTKQRASR